ncbi:hypothetical protein VaNZ11_005092, partial [Volvox africanus]
MRGPVSQRFSRQATNEAWSRGSRCTCRAKRYIPPGKQRNIALDGDSSSRRKASTPRDRAPPGQDDLLRELNSGGVGWLRDEEEQDWGLDDVAEHAKARDQQQLQRFGSPSAADGPAPYHANDRDGRSSDSSGGGAGGTGRRHDGRHRRIDAANPKTHGSPLASGLASISTEGETAKDSGVFSDSRSRGLLNSKFQNVESAGGVKSVTAAAAAAAAVAPGSADVREVRGHAAEVSLGAASASTGTAIPESSKRLRGKGRTTVEMESSYARCNPEVVEALRLRGFAVRVRQRDGLTGDDMDDGGDEEKADGGDRTGRGRDLDLDSDLEGFGLSDEDDGLDLELKMDLVVAQELRDDGFQSRKVGYPGDARNGQGAQSDSRTDWYDGLAAAGFYVHSNAAGEVFLERTVRRKKMAAAVAAAAKAALPGLNSPTTAAAGATAAGSPPQPQPQPPPLSVPSLASLSGRPAIVKALQRLTTPQQVLDFVELSYSQWAANGYRLADMQSGKPVAAPSPAEAAHCLRALATTALRQGIGGWRCLELAAGQQAQGLAEALRVTPPRLLPEQASQQLMAEYFDVARRFWLDSAAEPIIGDPLVGRARSPRLAVTSVFPGVAGADDAVAAKLPQEPYEGPMNVQSGRISTSNQSHIPESVVAASPSSSPSPPPSPSPNAVQPPGPSSDDDEFPSRMVPMSPSSLSYDPLYDSLVAKYTAISRSKQLRELASGGSSQPQQQENNRSTINGHVVPTIAARTGQEKLVLAPQPL